MHVSAWYWFPAETNMYANNFNVRIRFRTQSNQKLYMENTKGKQVTVLSEARPHAHFTGTGTRPFVNFTMSSIMHIEWIKMYCLWLLTVKFWSVLLKAIVNEPWLHVLNWFYNHDSGSKIQKDKTKGRIRRTEVEVELWRVGDNEIEISFYFVFASAFSLSVR